MSLTTAQFDRVYEAMVAGVLPTSEAPPEQVVAMTATDILDDPKVHMVLSQHAGRVYFFAVPSAVLASVGDIWTPLVAAFPSHPAHRGPGIYMLTSGNLAAAVLVAEDKFTLIFNTTPIVSAWAAEQGIQPFHVDGDTFDSVGRMRSVRGMYRVYADHIGQNILRYSAITACGMAVVFGVAFGFNHWLGAAPNNSDLSAARKMLEAALGPQEISVQVAQLQKVSGVAIRAAGVVQAYRIENNKEAFVLSLPEWVSRDYIDALGSGVTVRRVAGEPMVLAIKGAEPPPRLPSIQVPAIEPPTTEGK